MTARHRVGSKLVATEIREGSLPEVRQLAQQLLAEHQAQIATMTAWKRAWSKARPNHPITKALGDQPRDTRREPSVASRDRGRRRRRNSPGTSRQAGRVALDEHVGDQVLEAGGLDHEVRAAVSKREAVSWATP